MTTAQTLTDLLALIESPEYYEAKPHKAQRDLESVRAAILRQLDALIPEPPTDDRARERETLIQALVRETPGHVAGDGIRVDVTDLEGILRRAFDQGAGSFRAYEPPSDDERMAIADEISGIQVGAGYESVTIGIDAALEAADAILASPVWRNRGRGPITDELLGAMLSGVYTYERECDRRRGDISQEIFGHRGASIPEAAPTREGRVAAMRAALETTPSKGVGSAH